MKTEIVEVRVGIYSGGGDDNVLIPLHSASFLCGRKESVKEWENYSIGFNEIVHTRYIKIACGERTAIIMIEYHIPKTDEEIEKVKICLEKVKDECRRDCEKQCRNTDYDMCEDACVEDCMGFRDIECLKR